MKYGLIGAKLGHSYSKEIHEQLSPYQYELKELADESQFLSFMKQKDFQAINVTIPYKEKVIPFLQEIDSSARFIGSVNTILNKNGNLSGYNTDYDGMKEMIFYFNIPFAGKKVFILGTGGTSKTAQKVAKDLQASAVFVVSRSPKEHEISYEEMQTTYRAEVEVIVSTTPYGMDPNLTATPLINLSLFANLQGVVDVIYHPLNTALILQAKKRRIPCCGGLYMLVAQAFYASELFQNQPMAKEKIRFLYQKLKREKENIVLIGMPSCGKTTVGKKIGQLLNRQFVDTDQLIKEEIKMEISDYFALYGEESFRDLESQIIRKVSQHSSLVIATGGGSILREENVSLLKQNGKLYFIDRPVSMLTSTSSRPLSASKSALKKRYRERYPLYMAHSDYKIPGYLPKEEVARRIVEKWEENRI